MREFKRAAARPLAARRPFRETKVRKKREPRRRLYINKVWRAGRGLQKGRRPRSRWGGAAAGDGSSEARAGGSAGEGGLQVGRAAGVGGMHHVDAGGQVAHVDAVAAAAGHAAPVGGIDGHAAGRGAQTDNRSPSTRTISTMLPLLLCSDSLSTRSYS